VQFNWVDTAVHGCGLQYGFLADEIQSVFPHLTSCWCEADGSVKLGYDPVSLIPVLTSVVKQQSVQIAELQAKVAEILLVQRVTTGSTGEAGQ
jgi:hypothetical protein